MPHLLNFIKNNGTLLANDHTALISHTATGILTSLTGVYPDRMGQPVSNSFRYFKTDGTTRTGVSFAYWTAPLFDPAGSTTDLTPEMMNENGKIAPAPWGPFTRAGCDFGAVATANTILENTAIDIPTVFAGSPEAIKVAGDGGAAGTQSFADFVGIGVHCSKNSALCAASAHARPDVLNDEPGGYNGFNGLFGAAYVNPVITPTGVMTASLAYVLTLEDPQRFSSSREVGPYLGLVPKQEDSGDSQPQLGISKTGDRMLRRLLVGSSQYMWGAFGPDTDLRRYGLRLCERGGKNAKKRAVVAVVRKLAALLHRLWVTGDVYEPLHHPGAETRTARATAA
jgi:hypothetical protein